MLLQAEASGQSILNLYNPGFKIEKPHQLAPQASAADNEIKTVETQKIENEETGSNLPSAPAQQWAISQPAPGRSSSNNEKQSFHWKQALQESVTFLAIEQAWVVHTDFPWVVSERGIPFNHYWRDYKQSLQRWWQVGWSAGENPMYNYVGHPIQGAITEYIYFQNDPKSRFLEFSKSKKYWLSRVKGTIFNGVYSTQWSIGPVSEMTVEKYGSKDRPPWTASNSYPCDPKVQQCYWGVGKVNLVMTPVGGLGWVLAEDFMDRDIVRGVERRTTKRFWIDTARCTFNPIRAAGNILHGNRPWFRFRDIAESQPNLDHAQ